MLWMALLLPALPLDVFVRAMDEGDSAARQKGFAVVTGGPRPRIVVANATARAAGVRRQQLVTAAQALLPNLVLAERDPLREEAALAELATFVLGFTPHVSVVAPRAIVADIATSLRLFKGFAPLTGAVHAGITTRGYHVRMAFAPTPVAALAFARAGITTPVLNPAELAALLAPLSLACFDIDPALQAMLEAAGVTTFGAVCALPRDALAQRCGPAFIQLLDRARGSAADTRAPFVPPPLFRTRLLLPVPVHDVAALGFAVRRALRDLTDWLLARGLGVLRFELTLAHERHTHQRTGIPATIVRLALGGATRALPHLDGVLRERLNRVTLPAAVEAIALCTVETLPLAGHNFGLLPGDEVAAAGAPLLDRLRARLGDASVSVLVTHPEHRPEEAMRTGNAGARTVAAIPRRAAAKAPRATRSGPIAGAALPESAGLTPQTRIKPPPADAAATHAHAPVLPRPLWLLAEPQALPAAPEHAEWRRRKAAERIESGWWDYRDIGRDYYRVRGSAGEQLWVYRTHRGGLEDGDWFVHGLFA